jgi:type IV pilus biogenesis protein PilP
MCGNRRIICFVLVTSGVLANLPAPAAEAASADGPPAPAAISIPGTTPATEILKEISDSQTELALLELAIKKAELQKKLREIQIPRDAPSPPSEDRRMPAAAPITLRGGEQYAVRRVHRVNGNLEAVLVLPGGDIKAVKKGSVLAEDLVVADVRPEGVSVRRGSGLPYSLPAAASIGEDR